MDTEIMIERITEANKKHGITCGGEIGTKWEVKIPVCTQLMQLINDN